MSSHRNFRLSRAASIAVAGVTLLFSLTACGGSGAGSTDGSAPAGGVATTNPGTGTDTGSGSGKKAVSAADLCGFLKKNVAEWESVGSEVGAMARLTTDLAGFYEDHGVTPVGSDMDEQTQAECPDVRKKVLAAGGLESFRTL